MIVAYGQFKVSAASVRTTSVSSSTQVYVHSQNMWLYRLFVTSVPIVHAPQKKIGHVRPALYVCIMLSIHGQFFCSVVTLTVSFSDVQQITSNNGALKSLQCVEHVCVN